MHFQTLTKLTLITAIFCLNTLIAFPAHASALKPDTAWRIKTVTLPDGLPPYCSMRNHYSEANVSLILAQDMEDNISLAIDFSEPVLEQDKKYSVNLTIPKKTQKNFMSNAANANIIVSQIGQDISFLDNMGRGEELHVSMDNVNLQFALSGSLKGLKKLSKCVANLDDNTPIKSVSRLQTQNTFIKIDKPYKRPIIKNPNIVPTPKKIPVKTNYNEIETTLKSALNISDIDKSHSEQGVYSWKKSDLYGNAQIFSWPKGQSFSDIIETYIQKTKKRCPNNFASYIGKQLSLSGGNVYAIGNIACIGDETDNAAALLFHGMNNKFLVISHEGSSPQLPDALAIRDKISTHFLQLDAKQSAEFINGK